MHVPDVCDGSAQVETGLDGGFVVERPVEMGFEEEDGGLLKKLVAHEELLSASGDVSIIVEESHRRKFGLVHLKRDLSAHLAGDLCIGGWEDSWVESGGEIVETLVSDLIYHIIIIYKLSSE